MPSDASSSSSFRLPKLPFTRPSRPPLVTQLSTPPLTAATISLDDSSEEELDNTTPRLPDISSLEPIYASGSNIHRSSSIRSTTSNISASHLPSPLGDFQSDEVLNILPLRKSPQISAITPRFSPPPIGTESIQDEWTRLQVNGRGANTPTHNVVAPSWNPFKAPGLEVWTRESWGKRKVALISGITGQDGSYLTELLLDKGYTVHGIIRRSSSFNTSRLHHLFTDSHQLSESKGQMILHYGDLTDSTNLVYIISQVQPSEIYNLGAQSHVKVSFEMAEYTGDVDGLGTLRLLDAVRTCGLEKLVRFYQASTSELYGLVKSSPQNELTPFYPRSPYGVAKLYAYWIVVNYREAYDMFACNGILFNHESPRRGRTFVTRKITRAVAEISLGRQECMYMGNLDALRDWGHARDYVEGMWRILQHNEADDFVLASNETHSVRKFIEKSFGVVGMNIRWSGKGVDEVGIETASGQVVVRVDKKYFRPAEVEKLHGDCTKAEKVLGWKRTVDFDGLVREMVEADVESAKYLVVDHN